MSTPTYNKRDVQRILKNNGWTPHRQTGSHIIYENENGKHLTMRCGKCNKMILQRLIKEHNLKIDIR